MTMPWRKMGPLICMATTLVVAIAGQAPAQGLATNPATPVRPAPKSNGVESLFANWDTDHDKMLSSAEFAVGWQQLQATMASRRLHEQFTTLDTNNDRSLDETEYAQLELIKHDGKSAPPISAFDTDKNHRLNFKEYVNAVNYLLNHEHK